MEGTIIQVIFLVLEHTQNNKLGDLINTSDNYFFITNHSKAAEILILQILSKYFLLR